MKENWTTKSGKSVEIVTTPVGRTFGTMISLTIDGIEYANARLATANGQDVIEFTEDKKSQKLMITVSPAIVAVIKAESQEAAKLTEAELARLNRVDTYAENYRKVDQAMSK